MRTIYWYLHFTFTLIFTMFDMVKVKKKVAAGEDVAEFANVVASKWAMSQIKASGANIKVTGLENIPKDKAVLFVSNHQGNFDIAIFISYINKSKGYIAKAEMLKIPLLRDWMTYMKCLFMDRSDMRQSAETIVKGINILKSGYSLVVFPEGTRSKSNTVGEFKAGSFKLATKSKVPIVPVTINGSYKLMEQNNNKIKPADVFVTIHPMVEVAGLSKEEELLLPQKVKSIIEEPLKNL